MSFSNRVKAELCRELPPRKCCALAQCYGVLLYCNTFSEHEVKIVTGSEPFGRLLPRLFRRAFGIAFDTLPEVNARGSRRNYIITDPGKLDMVFEAYGGTRGEVLAHHINFGVLEEECCRQSFIRGAFLTGGSVTDPNKSYHLELVTDHYNVSRETYTLLLEMGTNPKETARSGNYILYFKQSTAIEEFLTMIGAPIAAMNLMSTKIEKDMRNSVNRKVNCDTANVSKIVDAAQQQIDAIERLYQGRGAQGLPPKLRETAQLRMENPELSLAELAALFNPPVTKSCLNHRLRKLIALAGEPQSSPDASG